MNTRNFSGTVSMAALIAAIAGPVGAQGINVTVDGDIVAFGAQKPVQQFGNVLVPLRGVFERLGATVAYDGGTKSILAVRGATTVQLKLGDAQAQVNGATRTLAVPAQAVNGTTLVPLRFVSEALGAAVKWQAASRTVIISTTENASAGSGEPTENPSGPSGTPEVTAFTHDGARTLRGGDVLTATLRGTPGGVASFSVPGIAAAKTVPMKETSAGVYEGAFTMPKGLTVNGASLLGSLKIGTKAAPVIQAGNAVNVDSVGPKFDNLSPAPNASLAPGKPLIYGTYTDAGSGINQEGTRILVNDADVTGTATVTDAFFSYRPATDLPLAKNTVTVVTKDVAGNESRKEWAFTLTAAESLIKTVTLTPELKTLEPGDEVTVQATAAPGGKARFSIGGSVVDRAMREEPSGVYKGTYTIRKGDSLTEAPATVTFTSAAGKTVTQAAAQPVTIAAGAPEKPVITNPKEGSAAGESVTITGTAKPGATVRYSLRYDGTLLILPAGGTVTEGEVKADAAGKWTIPAIALSAPLGITKVSYTLSAVTVGAASDQISEAAAVQFRR
ncbi:MAG: copper amine oxidase N-terminal domain-containing protein [Akkermansiaceae bacterium]|nr:copper amine oxidase N-terminal domain-containing protein [Armatimonadota bacterium]